MASPAAQGQHRGPGARARAHAARPRIVATSRYISWTYRLSNAPAPRGSRASPAPEGQPGANRALADGRLGRRAGRPIA